MATDNIPGPGAVVGTKLYVHLRPAGDADALYCWDSATDQTCGLVVLERGHLGDGSAPVLVGGRIWALGASGTLHCVEPATGLPCATPSVDTGLSGGSPTFDIVAHDQRVYVSEVGSRRIACVDTTSAGPCAGWPDPVQVDRGSNIVTRRSPTGTADGVCSVAQDGSTCVGDDGTVSEMAAWPLADTYYNITQEAEAGTRTLWGSLSRGGLGCWDWSTAALCDGPGFVDGWIDADVDGNPLPSAYGTTFDGACAVALGDPGQLFTVDPVGSAPCTSLGTGTRGKVIDLRAQRCDATVGQAHWRDVRVLDTDLAPGVELDSLVVVVRDAETGEPLASRELVGTGGTVDLSGIDAAAHPAVVLDATARSVGGNPAWADANPPQVELRWVSDPASGCFRTTTVVDCDHAATAVLSVLATIQDQSSSDELALIAPPSCQSDNHPPTATPQSVTTAEDTAVPIALTGADADGDALTFAVVTQPLHGTLSGSGPNLVYTPAPNFHGVDAFTFSSDDGTTASAPATVSLTVTAVNDRPFALDRTVSTPREVPVAVTLGGSDIDGDALTFRVLTGPAHGSLSGSGAALVYTPAPGFEGGDAFTYVSHDGLVDSLPATVGVTVTHVNHPPSATAQSVTTAEDTAVPVVLTGADPDGDALSFAVVTSPLHGTLSGAGPNLVYTPAPNFHGVDAFTFVADDGLVSSGAATVAITVTPVNDAPTAVDRQVSTGEDLAVPTMLAGADPDGDPLTFLVIGAPAHGTLSGTAPGLVYTPAPNFHGVDAFTYRVGDGQALSAPATFTITVTSAGDPPVASDQQVTTPQDTAATLTLAGVDPDGDSLSYTVTTAPAHGVLTGSAPDLTYTPAPGFIGEDSFRFVVGDGSLTSPAATVSITVTGTSACSSSSPRLDVAVSADFRSPVKVLTSPKLSTSEAGELILAFVSVDGPYAPTQRISQVTGGGLTWTLVSRANETWGTTEIWQARAQAQTRNLRVSAQLAKGRFDGSITVAAFTGSRGSGSASSSAGIGGHAVTTLVPRTCGSAVWAVGHDWSNAIVPRPADGQSIVHAFVDTRVHDSFWTQRLDRGTERGVPVAMVTDGPDGDRWTMVAVEILGDGG